MKVVIDEMIDMILVRVVWRLSANRFWVELMIRDIFLEAKHQAQMLKKSWRAGGKLEIRSLARPDVELYNLLDHSILDKN